MASRKSHSAVRSVAQRIREDVLGRSDGELLGSEDDLVARYGVSRPTLRQATSILVQEQLVTIRRGVRGGYFARIPTTRGVAHPAAVYLLAHATSMQEIIEAVAPIKAELAVLACRCDDADMRQQLTEFALKALPADHDDLYVTFLRSERNFSRILGRMSGNKVLALFLNILYDFCAQVPPERDVYRNRPDRIRTYWEARAGMVNAILARDGEVAAVYATRCADMVANWMRVDFEFAPPPLPEMIGMAGMLDGQGDLQGLSVLGASSAQPLGELASGAGHPKKVTATSGGRARGRQ